MTPAGRGQLLTLLVIAVTVLFPPVSSAQDAVKDVGELVSTMRTLRRDGKSSDALRAMRDAAPQVRTNLRVIGQRALALQDMRKLAAAEQLLASLPHIDGDPVLQIELAQLRVLLEKTEPEAEAASTRILQLAASRDGNLDVAALHVRSLIHGEEFRAARQVLDTLAGDSTTWTSHELEAELLAARARSLMTDDSLLEDALPLLEQALEAAPNRGDVRALYSEALVRWQRFEQAEEQLAIGLEDPGVDRDVLLMAQGNLYRSTDRLEDSVTCYESVLADTPDDLQAKVGLARCRSRMGAREEAVDLLEACLAKRPDDLDALLVLAEVREDQDRLPDAEALLRRALDVRPNHLKACWRLSRVLARQGKMDEVDELVERYESRRERLLERSAAGSSMDR